MSDDAKFFLWIVFIVGLCIGILIGGCIDNQTWKAQSVEHGFARYNEKTGVWEWHTNTVQLERSKP